MNKKVKVLRPWKFQCSQHRGEGKLESGNLTRLLFTTAFIDVFLCMCVYIHTHVWKLKDNV